MVTYDWKDNYGEPGRVKAGRGHGVRVMLWDCDDNRDATVHVVTPAKAREIAAALLQAADAEEGLTQVCEKRR
jgi:hypothetical protein